MAGSPKDVVLRARDVVVSFGDKNILDHLDLDVYRGEVLGFVGGSGAGKSVLMRTIIGLLPKRQGKIEVFGVDLDAATEEELVGVEQRWGILFQQGALFSSLNVLQNVQFPIREYLNVSERLMDEIAVILGIEKPHVHFTETVVHSKSDLKHQIQDLKMTRERLVAAHDYKKLHDVRRQIHELKHTIRKIEAKAAHG